jgi:1-phosphofructokinase family hexose kinase
MINDLKIFTKNRIERSWQSIGGKGINVSLVLGILGHPVLSFVISGKAESGLFAGVLEKHGVTPQIVSINKSTRRNYKVIEKLSGKDTEFNEKGFSISPHMCVRVEQEMKRLLLQCKYLALSGSLPLGIPPDFYKQLVNKANQEGIVTALDTSGLELDRSIDAIPKILRINKEELEEHVRSNLEGVHDISKMSKQICNKGVNWVVVSLGESGAVGTDSSGSWFVSPPKVTVKNTIGCGDAMLAGLLSANSKTMDLPDALLFSTSIATARVAKIQIADLDLEMARSLQGRIIIEKIN